MKLKKCILLLPTSYNDGSEVPASVISGILRSIDEAFDGHTIDGYCDGVYRMDDGSLASDHSLKVWIAVDPQRVDDVRKLAGSVARLLKQESIYFEVTDAEVEFVRPSAESDTGGLL
jgi:hypothetical protein